MSAPVLYVTGTNTGVGKTTLACLLVERARERNLKVAAMKPFCTGDRDDAEKLHALQTADLTLDEVNPFFFTTPVTPSVAARKENRSITLREAITAIQKIQLRNLPTLIEGAGGLLSPLGGKFTLLDIIHEVPGKICIVAPNTLGVINAALLTHRTLEKIPNSHLRFVLMNPSQRDASSESNGQVIHDWTKITVTKFPHLPAPTTPLLDDMLKWWIAE